MNGVQVFNNTEFGNVRALMIEDEPWFVGKDVATALGYSNTSDALMKHVDCEDKLTSQIATTGQNRNMVVINESGLYSLILSSKLDSAKKFKHWVTSEVLPAIRKTGSYALVTTDVTFKPEYMDAARIVSRCRSERLPVVMDLLSKAGLDVREVKAAQPMIEERRERKWIDDEDMEHLIDILNRAGTCEAAGEAVGLNKATISLYRRGIRKPTPERYLRIIEILDK